MSKILKFKNPPIIESVIEFRFEESEGLINIVPGLLKDFNNFQHLPLNNMPLSIRQMDPNLRYAPLLRFEHQEYVILLGDKVLGIGCKFPYPGWNIFKEKVNYILQQLLTSALSKNFIINRYAIKYINFLDNISDIKFEFKLGSFNYVENVILKTDLPKDDFMHSIQIVSNVETNTNGNIKQGCLLDIDSIKLERDLINFTNFSINLSNKLDLLHNSNKEVFLELLTERAINKMEPIYE